MFVIGLLPAQHTQHLAVFARDVPEFNREVLRAVDRVQATAMDGGGYFIGVKAQPPEAPFGTAVRYDGWCMGYFGRSTSYCSGSSYAAFLTALDSYNAKHPLRLSGAQVETLRTQEMDGSRREDKVKFWGWWNADGPGCYFALCCYTRAGMRVKPSDARPGDFMNIDWKSGLGHSVVFLAWEKLDGKDGVLFWSSQLGTNGYGDMWAPLDKVAGFVVTRATNIDNLRKLDPATVIHPKAVYDVPTKS